MLGAHERLGLMKISVIQTNSVHDKAKNIGQAKSFDRRGCCRRPARMSSCCRRCGTIAAGPTSDKLANADQIPGGPAYEALQLLARTHKIWVHGGSMIERIAGEQRVYNTTCVFNREGHEVARYRKIHMFDITAPDGTPYNESAHDQARRGDRPLRSGRA